MCHRRRFRISKIIIWSALVVAVVLKVLIGSVSGRINGTIIRITAADQLGKDYAELTKSDYMKIEELDLSGSSVTDISLVKKFPNLQKIDLSDTPAEIGFLRSRWVAVFARLGIRISTKKKIASIVYCRR